MPSALSTREESGAQGDRQARLAHLAGGALHIIGNAVVGELVVARIEQGVTGIGIAVPRLPDRAENGEPTALRQKRNGGFRDGRERTTPSGERHVINRRNVQVAAEGAAAAGRCKALRGLEFVRDVTPAVRRECAGVHEQTVSFLVAEWKAGQELP